MTDDRQPSTSTLTLIGTATMLLRLGPFTILTDPNFLHRGEEARIGFGLRTRRLTDPALEIGDLPELDAVVVSHLHGDHFDQIAERRLPKDVPIVTTRQGAIGLRAKGFTDARGLRPWRSETLHAGEWRLRVSAVPGRHAPRPLYALLPQVMGSVIDLHEGTERRLRLYVTGDTLFHDRLRLIPQRFPDIDAAAVHLGATKLFGLMLTMDASQGIRTIDLVRPRIAIPIHTSDYPIFTESLGEFTARVAGTPLRDRIRIVPPGATISLDDAVPARRSGSRSDPSSAGQGHEPSHDEPAHGVPTDSSAGSTRTTSDVGSAPEPVVTE